MTTAVELDNIATSNTFSEWVAAFNANNDFLEGLPLPIEAGTANGMRYVKLASGDVLIWGTKSHGTNSNYRCTMSWQGEGQTGYGYASPSEIVVDFPISLVNTAPQVFLRASDTNRCEMQVVSSGATTTTRWKGRYWCLVSDNASGWVPGSKSLDILVFGRWKA